MTNRELLIARIKLLPDTDIDTLLESATSMLETVKTETVSKCPHCGSSNVIRNGRVRGKQRYMCHQCEKTFGETTNTVRFNSHFGKEIWGEVIEDTACGYSIDYTASRLGENHRSIWGIRHKLLAAFPKLFGGYEMPLAGVVEADETFVLDNYKGKEFDENTLRKPRKHGAVAQKRGISDEYVCISTGVQRNGGVFAVAVNRAKPNVKDLQAAFTGRVADGTLILCDGHYAYKELPAAISCAIQDCTQVADEEKCFYHLNHANRFHNFVKGRYEHYCGVATKNLNKYNLMLAHVYRGVSEFIRTAKTHLLTVGPTDFYVSNREAQTVCVLAL